MATISSIGIGSGLDVESVITQLVAVERAPVTKLQTEASTLQTKLSTYGKLQSGMASLRDAALALTRASTWNATVGSRAVTPLRWPPPPAASTLPGSYSIEVQRLASVQSNATGVYASADSLVGEGTLRIELGTWGAGQSSFTPKAGATAVDITVGPPAESLAQLRDKINASNSGVVASVLTDASGAQAGIALGGHRREPTAFASASPTTMAATSTAWACRHWPSTRRPASSRWPRRWPRPTPLPA
jgi:flagellar hook-associated protein 2